MADEGNGGTTPEWSEVKPVQATPPVYTPRPFGAGSFPAPPPGAYAAAGISQGMLTPKPKSRAWLAWVLGGMAVLVLLMVIGGVKVWNLFQESGKSVIVPLHQAMVRGDIAGIFAASDPAYQEQVGEEKNSNLFTLIHDKMGDPVSYMVVNVNTSTTSNDGQRMTLVLNTKFTKGMGTETLVYHKDGGVWRLIGYHCLSPLLKGHTESLK